MRLCLNMKIQNADFHVQANTWGPVGPQNTKTRILVICPKTRVDLQSRCLGERTTWASARALTTPLARFVATSIIPQVVKGCTHARRDRRHGYDGPARAAEGDRLD